ncbi:hypothetical protein QJS04_geneDACA001208 [Acorus gramineus]|uniref:Uncharacterized protein n=1 Tax=Acorus gramineus TaxID=55184 RepID=A0AAV9ADB7_ACOGR|nr:hypothetical protein QJS04_geneDACA001208 [Acorus gramineus]
MGDAWRLPWMGDAWMGDHVISCGRLRLAKTEKQTLTTFPSLCGPLSHRPSPKPSPISLTEAPIADLPHRSPGVNEASPISLAEASPIADLPHRSPGVNEASPISLTEAPIADLPHRSPGVNEASPISLADRRSPSPKPRRTLADLPWSYSHLVSPSPKPRRTLADLRWSFWAAIVIVIMEP